jgi:hypothetical protein
MSLTLTTKYLEATNTRGARIKVKCFYGESITVPYNHAFSGVEMHTFAVLEWLRKYKLDNKGFKFAIGDSDRGYVFSHISEVATFDNETFQIKWQ